jgi:hypothetical protein
MLYIQAGKPTEILFLGRKGEGNFAKACAAVKVNLSDWLCVYL